MSPGGLGSTGSRLKPAAARIGRPTRPALFRPCHASAKRDRRQKSIICPTLSPPLAACRNVGRTILAQATFRRLFSWTPQLLRPVGRERRIGLPQPDETDAHALTRLQSVAHFVVNEIGRASCRERV